MTLEEFEKEKKRVERNAYRKAYRAKNIEKVRAYERTRAGYNREYGRKYWEDNKERINAGRKAYAKDYYEANRERINEANKAYYRAKKKKHEEPNGNSPESRLAKKKEYREKNKDKINDRSKEYYKANRELKKAYQRERYKAYYEANKERLNARSRAYYKAKKQEKSNTKIE